MSPIVSPSFRFVLMIAAAGCVQACVPVVAGGAGTASVAVVQERTVGRAVDDVTIRALVTDKFLKSTTPGLANGVSAEVTEGVVLLTGKVPQEDSVIEAVRLTWEVTGVKEVINEIQVTDPAAGSTLVGDAWITTQVKTRLLAEKNLKSVNYNIETVAGKVYVMGIAQSQEELDKALYIVSRVKGVLEVISHVRLKDDPRRPIPRPTLDQTYSTQPQY